LRTSVSNRSVVEPFVGVLLAAERLDHAQPQRLFLDVGCDVAGLVLCGARQHGELPLKVQHRDGDRHDRHHDHDAERPVHRQQDARDGNDLNDVEHQEQQPERQELADGAEVVHHPRKQLPGLPFAVKGHGQQLQSRVEVLPDVGFDAHGGAGHQPTTDEPQHGLGDQQGHGRCAEHPQSLRVLVPYRPVDHGLRHQRNGDGGSEAE
jgi:hypothetical protein